MRIKLHIKKRPIHIMRNEETVFRRHTQYTMRTLDCCKETKLYLVHEMMKISNKPWS